MPSSILKFFSDPSVLVSCKGCREGPASDKSIYCIGLLMVLSENINVAKPVGMLSFCIQVGILPRFPSWSMVMDNIAYSQIMVQMVSLFHLVTESQLGRQSMHRTSRKEACV